MHQEPTQPQPSRDIAGNTAGRRTGLSVRDAAEVLGISENAVRQRIQRGTIDAEKVAGRVVIYLADDAPPTKPPADTPADTPELVEVLRDEVEHLRQLIERERDARQRESEINAEELHRRDVLALEQQRTIAGLSSQIHALAEPRESPESAFSSQHEASIEEESNAPPESVSLLWWGEAPSWIVRVFAFIGAVADVVQVSTILIALSVGLAGSYIVVAVRQGAAWIGTEGAVLLVSAAGAIAGIVSLIVVIMDLQQVHAGYRRRIVAGRARGTQAATGRTRATIRKADDHDE